ncbi:competence/damage-inducible protein A [Pelagibius litoralis]|uniref:Competence/damage-inducible protein A n=1 Tax=Pelagibius litoralis TaxID=374515 RepID=A0A967EY59_9PROT|nr:molybdopterin-binding protein [Pelagibius litoralis]NIA69596.1 competence/damage-inducible protein A [Pelagibius litoralis]
MTTPTVTACLLIIGNEILSGRTQDKNLAYIGEQLNLLGVRMMEVRVVPDDEAVIVSTLNEVRRRFDYVFTTGGIGPTHDDITAECVAKAFGVPLIVNPEARAILEAHYEAGQLNEARLRMARTPEGADLIDNPVSKAPGFQMENVFVMAGIPAIMQAMFQSLRHRLVGGAPLQSRTVTLALGEGTIAAALGKIQDQFPSVEIGSYPFNRNGNFGVRVVLRSTEEDQLEQACGVMDTMIAGFGSTGDWDRGTQQSGEVESREAPVSDERAAG